MPFTEFCCRSGGSNLNAGTRTGSSTEPGTTADLTYASGSWDAATGVFTVASGNPSSDGVAVGDFASVYSDGSTVTSFVGRVTAVSTTTITVSLTAKAGTAPTDGTGNRTLKIGGAWAGPSGTSGFPLTLSTLASLVNAASDANRVNMKNNATYFITSAITTASNGPTTIEGYTSSYGDGGRFILDGGTSGASYVLLTLSGLAYTLRHAILRNNGATGSASGLETSGANNILEDVVVNSVRGNGISATSASTIFVECETYSCNQSNTASLAGFRGNISGALMYLRCIAHDNSGSNTRGFMVTNGNPTFIDCISDTNGSNGFDLRTNALQACIVSCDAYNNSGDGMFIGAAVRGLRLESSNLVKNGGYGLNSDAVFSTTFPSIGRIVNCGFGSGTQANTSGATNGLGQFVVSGSVTYAADMTPWVDPANGDFSINLGDAKGAGRGTFTQTAASYSGTVGYPDIGAAQAAVSGGGSRMVNIRGGADQ